MWVGTPRRRKQHGHVWAGCENPSIGAFFLLPLHACIAGVKQCLRICACVCVCVCACACVCETTDSADNSVDNLKSCEGSSHYR